MDYKLESLKKRLAEINEWLKHELALIRSGRASPALLDRVTAEVYGVKLSLKELGSFSAEDARVLRFTPWDKSQIKAVESAISAANLGAAVVPDGNSLRIIFSELTDEKRRLMTRMVKQKVEEAKISLRLERERVWSDIQQKERNGELAEDDKFRLKDLLQKTTEETTQKLEEAGERKETEILH